jgi:hypothetical protein
MPINSRTHCPSCSRKTEAENVGPDISSVPVYCVPGCIVVVERSAVAMGQVYVE